jgi:hypothetical protein
MKNIQEFRGKAKVVSGRVSGASKRYFRNYELDANCKWKPAGLCQIDFRKTGGRKRENGRSKKRGGTGNGNTKYARKRGKIGEGTEEHPSGANFFSVLVI